MLPLWGMTMTTAHPLKSKPILLQFWLFSFLLFSSQNVMANASAVPATQAPLSTTSTEQTVVDPNKVDLTSDNLFYDDVNQKMIAEGAVEIAQAGRVVKADRVEYDVQSDRVIATGNVALMEENGDVHFVDRAEFTDKMKNGTVAQLRSLLADGSRFTARTGERINGTKIKMKEASYTPCEPCKLDPSKPPVWQIKAGEVEHDSVDKSITYRDARFELGGTPIFYTPYFSHPDGTEKQKAGFLPPTFSLVTDLGFGVTSKYYIPVDRSEDITLGLRVLTEQAPVLLGEHRKRFNNAEIISDASVTYADRKDSVSGQAVTKDEEFRGHLFSEGQLDINDKWRAGYGLQLTSDDQYLRQYDISSEDVLENEVYAERFDNRNYAVGRILAFQDVRVSNRSTDQPNILPEIKASFMGDPNATLGGRWNLDASFLGVARDGNGQDVIRGSTNAGWQRRDVFRSGIVNTLNAAARADLYSIPNRDSTLLGAGGEGDSTAARLYTYAQNITTYPLINRMDTAEWLVEPTLSIKVSPNVKNNTDIPNEDSQDVQIDSNNIFASDRFPGLDRIEDRSNVTYGVRTGVYGDDGSFGDVFLGQAYRLNDDDNPFPTGSGLEEQTSNYIGQVSSRIKDKFTLNYRFELDNESMRPNRHELDGNLYWGRLGVGTTYLYSRALEGTDLLVTREQIAPTVTYKMNDQWTVGANARYELSDTSDRGLRGSALSLSYLGQCLNFATTIDRSVSNSITGEPALEVMMRIGLKNLGEFGVAQ